MAHAVPGPRNATNAGSFFGPVRVHLKRSGAMRAEGSHLRRAKPKRNN